MSMPDYTVGKNVTLKRSSLDMIMAYTNKTKKNFSQTLNIILEEWDELSLIKSKQESIQQEIDEEAGLNAEIADLRNAKILKEELKVESKNKHRRSNKRR